MTQPTHDEPGTPGAIRYLPRFDKTRLRDALLGVLLGWLMGYLLIELGLQEISNRATQTLVIVPGVIAGIFGAFSLLWIPAALDGILILIYFAIANTPFMSHVARRWVRSDPLPASADAIIVLSANVNSDGMLNAHGVQRLLTGIELYQRRIAPRLFTTVIVAKHGDLIQSSTADQRRLVQMGGATAAWTSLTGALNTRDEAVLSAAQLPAAARSVIVVTSPMHTRRACGTFEAVGFKVVCVASREQSSVTWHPLASENRLASFREYAYERLAMIKYRANGWLPRDE